MDELWRFLVVAVMALAAFGMTVVEMRRGKRS